MCTFCPQDNLKASYGKSGDKYMSLESFTTILDKLPLDVRVEFSGMAEPWANPETTKMLELALQRGGPVGIYTTLYGMSVEDSVYITETLLPKFENQIYVLCLHMPDSKMNMRGYKGSEDYRQVLKNFLKVVDAGVFPKRKFRTMTMDKTGAIHPDIEDLLPQLGAWTGHSRAGSLGQKQVEKVGAIPPAHHESPIMCASTPFYDHNVLLPNGDVVLCCMDYAMKHVIGNLLETDYWSLFTSPEMNRLRVENQKSEFSKCSICKQCGNILGYNAHENKLVGSRGYGSATRVHFKDVVGYAKRKLGVRVSK
jgi:hypothetical protein